MADSVRSSFSVRLLGAGVLAIAGCSEPGSPLDNAGPAASAELVTAPPLRLAPIQDSISPARLAGFIGYYAPGPNTPDHELSWIRTETGPLRRIRSTVRRHGTWVRRDWSDGGRTNTEFIHLPTGITVSEARDAAGQVLVHSIRAPLPDVGEPITYAGRPTTVGHERLGESCEDHVVYSTGQFRRVACVTPDGISLSEHTESADGEVWSTSPAFATRLTRRAVPADGVQPPRFDREAWLGDPTLDVSDGGGNYTVVLEPEQGGVQYLMRRRPGWTAEEKRSGDGSATLSARNPARGRWVVARLGPGARPEAVTYGSLTVSGPDTDVPAKLDRPGETILGLSCDWYDVMPNVHDIGRLECRAPDGMPLRIQTISRGSIRTDAIATRFDRRQSAAADVLPPQAWTSPQAWGVPAPDR